MRNWNNRTWFIFKYSTSHFVDLSKNLIERINKNAFSSLKNLQKLDLSDNDLSKFDRNLIGLGNSVEVKIENNDLIVDFWLSFKYFKLSLSFKN